MHSAKTSRLSSLGLKVLVAYVVGALVSIALAVAAAVWAVRSDALAGLELVELTLLTWTSEGALGGAGLRPAERFSDQRMLQSARVAKLDRAAGLVRFAGCKPEHLGEAAMPTDAQDWLSWMLQLPALLAADPALRQPSQRIAMFDQRQPGDAQSEAWLDHHWRE
jgi:hypothetical protein